MQREKLNVGMIGFGARGYWLLKDVILPLEKANIVAVCDNYEDRTEKAADMVVREEDKAFIADFYKYGFVGLVLEWIDKGMKEDPKQIIERLNALIQGSFAHALNNAKLNRS